MQTAPRWGFVFLACPVRLTEEQRMDLVRLAAQAWFEELPSIRFDWEECRGEVRVASDVVALGTFCGQRFIAEVHLPTGSATVDFLVAEAQLVRRDQVAEA